MNISDVAALSGLPAKTIRYYEDVGLVRPAHGTNGYRAFDESDVHKRTFLARARSLGFTIEDCRALIALGRVRTSSRLPKITSPASTGRSDIYRRCMPR